MDNNYRHKRLETYDKRSNKRCVSPQTTPQRQQLQSVKSNRGQGNYLSRPRWSWGREALVRLSPIELSLKIQKGRCVIVNSTHDKLVKILIKTMTFHRLGLSCIRLSWKIWENEILKLSIGSPKTQTNGKVYRKMKPGSRVVILAITWGTYAQDSGDHK